jgi:hypothetical protein
MGIAPNIGRNIYLLQHCTSRKIIHGMENAKLLEHVKNASGKT